MDRVLWAPRFEACSNGVSKKDSTRRLWSFWTYRVVMALFQAFSLLSHLARVLRFSYAHRCTLSSKNKLLVVWQSSRLVHRFIGIEILFIVCLAGPNLYRAWLRRFWLPFVNWDGCLVLLYKLSELLVDSEGALHEVLVVLLIEIVPFIEGIHLMQFWNHPVLGLFLQRRRVGLHLMRS